MNTRLELRHLRLVRALSQAGGMSLAAKQLHLSQSALSHQLKVLEDTLGHALFLRQGKKLIMTAAGHRVLHSADKVMNQLHIMQDELGQIEQGKNVTVRIATECYTSFHWLPKVIPRLKQQYPDINIELHPQATNQVTQRLASGDIDLAIKMVPAKAPFKNHILFSDELVVVMSKHHPLAQHSVITPADLAQENLVLCPNAKEKLLMGLSQHIDTASIHTTTFPLTEAIIEWCDAGMGISVLANWSAASWQRDNIVSRPLAVNWAKRTWAAVTLPHDLPTYTQDLITLLKDHSPI